MSPGRVRRLAPAVAAATVLALAGCGGGERKSGPRVSRTAAFFGMNVQQLPPLLQSRPDVVDRSLGEIRALGAGWVRSTVDWKALAPRAPRGAGLDFAATDVWMTAVARHGLSWEPIGIGSPPPRWALVRTAATARCGAFSPPRVGPYVALMAGLARRYGRDGTFWAEHPELPARPVTSFEIWNEPNSGFWCPRPDPTAYARLYAAARDAIHGVDGDARVLVGGLAPYFDAADVDAAGKMTAATFVAGLVAADPGLRGGIDAVGVHPYGTTPDAVLEAVGRFRAALHDSGLADVPMVANEFGWATLGLSPALPPVPEATRARYLPDAASDLARTDCGLLGEAPHTWISAQRNPAATVDWYGLADPATGAPSGSALAYGKAVHALESGPQPGLGPC